MLRGFSIIYPDLNIVHTTCCFLLLLKKKVGDSLKIMPWDLTIGLHIKYHMFSFPPLSIKIWKERFAFVGHLFLGSKMFWQDSLANCKLNHPHISGVEKHYANDIVKHNSLPVPLEFVMELFYLESKCLFLHFLYLFLYRDLILVFWHRIL